MLISARICSGMKNIIKKYRLVADFWNLVINQRYPLTPLKIGPFISNNKQKLSKYSQYKKSNISLLNFHWREFMRIAHQSSEKSGDPLRNSYSLKVRVKVVPIFTLLSTDIFPPKLCRWL